MAMADRRRAFLLGHDAEFWAGLLLRAKGYRILARRYLRAGGEIDLIAQRFGTLAFVEVKARPSLEEALATISEAKLARMARPARAFLAGRQVQPKVIRCDAILVAPGRWPRHIEAVGELPLD
jgi:putative endonuclease